METCAISEGAAALETYRLFDDVADLFTQLRRSGIPVALITNGASDTQREKLSALGIKDWFNAVVISGELGVAKPSASIFSVALKMLAVEREYAWHVGDGLDTDVAGAKATGLTAVWLNRNGRKLSHDDPQPDTEIQSLRELLHIVPQSKSTGN